MWTMWMQREIAERDGLFAFLLHAETRLAQFVLAYMDAADDGLADCLGSVESRRVYDLWIQAGHPEPIKGFVVEHANRLAAGEEAPRGPD